jgi:hypothetical protein
MKCAVILVEGFPHARALLVANSVSAKHKIKRTPMKNKSKTIHANNNTKTPFL